MMYHTNMYKLLCPLSIKTLNHENWLRKRSKVWYNYDGEIIIREEALHLGRMFTDELRRCYDATYDHCFKRFGVIEEIA